MIDQLIVKQKVEVAEAIGKKIWCFPIFCLEITETPPPPRSCLLKGKKLVGVSYF